MAAYSGIYRVEGDKWTTKSDLAWTETWVGSDQERFFTIEGDTLAVMSTSSRNGIVPLLEHSPTVSIPVRAEAAGAADVGVPEHPRVNARHGVESARGSRRAEAAARRLRVCR